MERQFYIISYDIGEPRRLQKVYKFLKDYGQPVQKSVFECWLTPKELQTVISWLADFIKRTEDRVRIYRLCRHCLKNLEFSGPVYAAEEPPEELIL